VSAKYLFNIILLLLTALMPAIAYTQEPTLIHYTVEDGLPSNTVYYIYKDHKGFLWFATDKGISRYNGITFRNFTTFDGLADNEVFNFQEDYQGRLWMSTYNGKLCYYKDGAFHTEKNTPWLYLKTKAVSRTIALQDDSTVTISNIFGYYILQIKNNTVKSIAIDHKKLNVTTDVVLIKKNGNNLYSLFDMSSNKIVEMDTLSNTLNETKFEKNNQYLHILNSTGQISILFHGKSIYSLNEELLFSFINLDSSFYQHSLFAMKADDVYFIATKIGLHLGNDFYLFRGEAINYIAKDINKNYWIASYNKGVYNFYTNYKNSIKYSNTYETKVWDATILNGKLFFVLENGGLYKFDQGKSKCLFNPSSFFKNHHTSRSNEQGWIENNSYWYIGNGNVYHIEDIISDHPNAIVRQNFIKNVLPKKVYKERNNIYFIYQNDMFRVNYKDFISKNINEINKIFNIPYTAARIYSSTMDYQRALWYCKSDSIFKIINGKYHQYQPQLNKIQFRNFSFYYNYIVGYNLENTLYVVNNYSSRDIKIDSVRGQNCIWEKFYKIDERNILLSTNDHYRLLTLYPPRPDGRPAYTIKTVENPYIPERAEYVCADTAHTYFFRDGNITSMVTRDLLNPTPVPKILFAEVRSTTRTLPVRDRLTLSYSESREVTLSFIPISFYSKDLYYEYSIAPKDDTALNWQPIRGEVITLLKPQYGTYRIRVRVRSVSSAFSAPAAIELVILRPYWATAWFLTCCALALMALTALIVWVFYRRKLRIQSKEHLADIRYQKSEYKALNALMNPHFIFNSLNNIQGLINANDRKAANDYLVIFSDLVRQNMHNITEGAITLYQELELVRNYLILEKLRFGDLVSYGLIIGEAIDTEAILVPPLLIQPLVENAIRHGLLPRQSDQSLVTIRVWEEEEKVFIEIRDNGIGIERSRAMKEGSAHRSYGLENLVKRIEHWNAINGQNLQFTIGEAGDGTGTVAVLVAG